MDLDALERVFHAALDLPEDQRDDFLRKECAGQEEFLAEIRRLIERDGEADSLLRSPISNGNGNGEQLNHGQQLGNYQLLDILGRGGMGEVWLAQRADGTYQKKVALKVMRSALRPDAIARFDQERQIQASLDHPGIARLLDAGETPKGRPYYVVEHVDGEAVDAWCDKRKLPLEERLALFQEICRTVDHAHQNLVIHRDLKPANILVTSDGRPKLLDFGIAKILEGQPGVLPDTIEGHQPLTPRFASPEQFRGERVNVSSDVFSLGVLLYLLLTGRLPFEEKSTSEELSKAICSTPPPSPSQWFREPTSSTTTRWNASHASDQRRTTAPRLGRRLQGDLDAIVQRALERDSARRYTTAGDLADDIDRFLERRPVMARSPSGAYRARRFVQRNKALVGMTTLALIGLVGGLITSSSLYAEAKDAWDTESELRELAEGQLSEIQDLTADLQRQITEADDQRRRAETHLGEVRHFASRAIFNLFNKVYALEGANEALQEIVQTGLDALQTLREEAEDDPSFLRELMAAHSRLASLQGGQLSVSTQGRDLALWNAETAVELGRQLMELDPGQDANLMNMSRALLSLGDVLRARGRGADAETAEREALKWSDSLTRPHQKPGNLVVRVAALRQVAEWELVAGSAEQAAVLAQQGLAEIEEGLPRFLGTADILNSEKAALQILIARHHLLLGDGESAVQWTRQAVALSEAHDRLRAMALQALQWHVRALMAAELHEEAESTLYHMLDEVEEGLERFPDDVRRQAEHVMVYSDLCNLARHREDWDGFDGLSDEVIDLGLKYRRRDPASLGIEDQVLRVRIMVYESWMSQGEWGEAQDALDVFEQALQECQDLGWILQHQGEWKMRARRDRAAILLGRAEDAPGEDTATSQELARQAMSLLEPLEQEIVASAAVNTARRRLLSEVRDLLDQARALSGR